MAIRRGGRRASDWLADGELVRLVDRIARIYGLSASDRDEIVQETSIAVWMTARPGAIGTGWVVRVAMNKTIDLVRCGARERARNRAYTAFVQPGRPIAELKHLLHARMTTLPERLRQFYVLHYVEGWSEREIANRLGVSRKSVRWLDNCCRQALVRGAICYQA